jgi:hypothetical protein
MKLKKIWAAHGVPAQRPSEISLCQDRQSRVEANAGSQGYPAGGDVDLFASCLGLALTALTLT